MSKMCPNVTCLHFLKHCMLDKWIKYILIFFQKNLLHYYFTILFVHVAEENRFIILHKWVWWSTHLFIWIYRLACKFTADIFLPILEVSTHVVYVLFGGMAYNCLSKKWQSLIVTALKPRIFWITNYQGFKSSLSFCSLKRDLSSFVFPGQYGKERGMDRLSHLLKPEKTKEYQKNSPKWYTY